MATEATVSSTPYELKWLTAPLTWSAAGSTRLPWTSSYWLPRRWYSRNRLSATPGGSAPGYRTVSATGMLNWVPSGPKSYTVPGTAPAGSDAAETGVTEIRVLVASAPAGIARAAPPSPSATVPAPEPIGAAPPLAGRTEIAPI